ncbi:MAG: hypothetical protein DRH12_10120 [Deltaproteobacteria bacterium]|nr:MAG: hypothetical protein DRH12_10120 [Deltaproteobacteria bacterium]
MKAEFLLLSPEYYHLWDRFVDISPQGSIFAKTFYLKALGAPFKIGVIMSDSGIQGGLVLAKNELGVYSNPLLAKYLGILLRPAEGKYVNRITVEKQLTEQIVSCISWCRSFDYTFHPSFKNWLPFYWRGYRQEVRYTYRINDSSNLEKIYGEVESRVRKNIRKAQRHGIEVVDEVPSDIFYKIWNSTFKRQGGSAPISFQKFENIRRKLEQEGCIKFFGAKDKKGRFHAVTGIVFDSRCSYLLFNGMDTTLPNYEANTFLVLETISRASQLADAFDFEGSMLKSVERFYRGFGGQLTPYYNIWKANLFNNLKRWGIKTYKRLKYGQ